MRRFLVALVVITSNICFSEYAHAQQCYQVVAFVAPSPLYCQQTGVDNLGRPIWTCCR